MHGFMKNHIWNAVFIGGGQYIFRKNIVNLTISKRVQDYEGFRKPFLGNKVHSVFKF